MTNNSLKFTCELFTYATTSCPIHRGNGDHMQGRIVVHDIIQIYVLKMSNKCVTVHVFHLIFEYFDLELHILLNNILCRSKWAAVCLEHG